MTRVGRRRLVAAALLAVATAACGVPTSDAQVTGVGPDTSPAALERAGREEEAAEREREGVEATRQDLRRPSTDPAGPSEGRAEDAGQVVPPSVDEEAPTEEEATPDGTVSVLLRDDDGTRYVARPTTAPADPAALVAALAAPLTTAELASGLWSEVPAETYLAGIERRGSRSLAELGGFDGGGTDAAIRRRSQQVACTLVRHLPATVTVEVHAGREVLGVFGEDGDACP